ncbi:MAG: transcriptional repressor LexA [Ruminococcaceae bacterium]|nr:transcriptional repressor LexA [Oscillospiraceae bacterium]
MRVSRYSEKEQAIFDYINDTIRREGYSPSVRDIQTALGIKSTSTVHAYLRRLEEKGRIRKDPGKSRTLHIDTAPSESVHTLRVPLLGQVRAGMPILAVENYEGYIDYPAPPRTYAEGELFSLRVTGDSMMEAGILDGDILVVKAGQYAENGEIVVALVEDGATVKTFYKENGHFRLQPENRTMKPILVDEVYLLGKVVANLRFYDR